MALFGFVGYVFYKLDCEPAPLILGFILGPLMEENLRRAMIVSHGDPTVFVTAADQPDAARDGGVAAAARGAAGIPQDARGGVHGGVESVLCIEDSRPLIPAQAGIQGQRTGSPLSRGDERSNYLRSTVGGTSVIRRAPRWKVT